MNGNNNLIWTSVIAEELANHGLKYAIIGAGSRSTPLTLAFSKHPKITTISQVDERSASFMALGIAKYSKKPVVVVCTSGTAAANFYPAIIEAKLSNIPLIVCTADRPHFLRDSGANQTIDQVKLYGDQVNWFTDLKPPKKPTIEDYQYLRTITFRMWEKSQHPLGPIHVNFPFEKPLEPVSTTKLEEVIGTIPSTRNPFTKYIQGTKIIADETIADLKEMIVKANRIMVIAGPEAHRECNSEIVHEFTRTINAILVSDGLSGYRYKSKTRMFSSFESSFQNSELTKRVEPDFIIQVGPVPISKYLQKALKQWNNATKVNIAESSQLRDGSFNTTMKITADPEHVFVQLIDVLRNEELSQDDTWFNMLQKVEDTSWEIISDLLEKNDTEAKFVREFISQLPPNSTLFVASSLPVRHVDQFVRFIDEDIKIYANRGASGIDGTLSSALGISLAHDGPSFLLSGDLAFYHDSNGLLAKNRYNIPISIGLINNSGGAIFDRLPISNIDPPFTEYFLTPQKISFTDLAKAYHTDYQLITSLSDLELIDDGILEFRTELKEIERFRKILHSKIETQLSELLK